MNEATRQDQDGWRPGRMKELPEGDEYAIQLPLGPHTDFLSGFTPLAFDQPRLPCKATRDLWGWGRLYSEQALATGANHLPLQLASQT